MCHPAGPALHDSRCKLSEPGPGHRESSESRQTDRGPSPRCCPPPIDRVDTSLARRCKIPVGEPRSPTGCSQSMVTAPFNTQRAHVRHLLPRTTPSLPANPRRTASPSALASTCPARITPHHLRFANASADSWPPSRPVLSPVRLDPSTVCDMIPRRSPLPVWRLPCDSLIDSGVGRFQDGRVSGRVSSR